ncbi:MAG: molybdopterin cofactor-binding domain-containing protein [Steroidobacteraceae bacterium]
MSVNRVRGGVDAAGKAVALHHAVVGNSVVENWPLKAAMMKDGVDLSQMEGSSESPYEVPNRRFEALVAVEQVPTQFWRSVGHSHNGFILNGAIDELAALGRRDPYELRRELLADRPRHLAVLEKAATEAGQGKPLPAGHFHGIALQESFGSIVAGWSSVTDGTTVKVHRVTAAVDCGFAVNPQQVVAQIQGGVIFGMSMALYNQITLQDGVIQQDNFDTYPIVRLEEVPQIDVHIVENGGPLGGIGEPGLPPFAPALAGAIFAATGKRIRRLPLSVALAYEAAAQGDAPGTGHDRAPIAARCMAYRLAARARVSVDVGAGAGDGAGAAGSDDTSRLGRFIDCASSHCHCRHDRTCGGARAATVDGRAATRRRGHRARLRAPALADRLISPPSAVSSPTRRCSSRTAARAARTGRGARGLEALLRDPGRAVLPGAGRRRASGTLAATSGPVRNPAGQVIGRFHSIWRREADGHWRIVFDRGESPCDCRDTAPAPAPAPTNVTHRQAVLTAPQETSMIPKTLRIETRRQIHPPRCCSASPAWPRRPGRQMAWMSGSASGK